MPLLALGLNHKTAPVDVREQIAFSAEQTAAALQDLAGLPAINEAAIISTCNRTEIYCELDQENDQLAIDWLLKHHNLKGYDPKPYLYSHLERHSVQHLFRVACGLDSLILGEPQILGQIKSAFQIAAEAGTIGLQLNRLFQYSFSVAKQIRTHTEIGSNPISVAFAAVRLAHQIFTNLEEQTALLIGAGETIDLVAKHLSSNGIRKIIIANRTLSRAEKIAQQYGGKAITFATIPEQLQYSDIVISSTASTLPILGKGAVESALKIRKHKPIFMVDIAVPRDIEPEVENLDDVYLYTIDDLEEVVKTNLESRQAAAKQAESIIDIKVDEFMDWQNSLSAIETINQYRASANKISDEVLRNAQKMIANGKSGDEVIQYIARTLTNKLIHTPTITLKDAAKKGNHDLIEAANILFNLKNDIE